MPTPQEMANMDQEAEEEIGNTLEEDYDVASELREDLVPQAFYFYLGLDMDVGSDSDSSDDEENKKSQQQPAPPATKLDTSGPDKPECKNS
jgi:hypothetical protein